MAKTPDEYMKLPYHMRIDEDKDEGGYVVSFPELPGCITCGETIEDAIKNAEDAKLAWFEAALEDGVDIQESSSKNQQEFDMVYKSREEITGMSLEEELHIITGVMQKKLNLLHSLPPEEAQKMAHQNLIDIGVLNPDGSVAEPYQSDIDELEYKGFHAKIEYSPEDNAFIGKVTGIPDTLVFDGIFIEEIESQFHKAIDDYLMVLADNARKEHNRLPYETTDG